MSTSVVKPRDARAKAVEFAADMLIVRLEDGRSLSVPLEWFPRLRSATADERGTWQLIGRGAGIRWPALDEDISVAGLLGFPD
jgi:hypothetical protein